MKQGAITALQILIITAVIGAALTAAILLFRHDAAQNADVIIAAESGYINKAIH